MIKKYTNKCDSGTFVSFVYHISCAQYCRGAAKARSKSSKQNEEEKIAPQFCCLQPCQKISNELKNK